ncbi:PREDICTED: protoheme IX farnesyltransferase, mitochondrial isoform X2 [Prunus mume]|uniref:Heme O synthase n=1 Tax=Prunus mume TaxID=102107 RepID=A0ABM1LKV3_PRUMU|nr:PREDICTED: protoheme IX farnesyltransferase, mitochondrial isoform X2 [Prunus mume]
MWRNSLRFSPKLVISNNSLHLSSISSSAAKDVARPPLLSHSFSQSYSYSPSPSPSDSLKLGFQRPDGFRALSAATAVDLASGASKASYWARHYGRCYWELSKARLRLLQANMLAAGLAASNLILYAFVYTPLKQIHPVNTWVGAVVGAIPPLLGWAAAAGQVSLNAMLLPAALYFWQIPHFMALAYLCRNDYAAGGFRMLSLADASGQKTALVALRNCVYLIPLGFLAYDWGMTSGWFCLESTLLTLAITATAFSFHQDRSTHKARKMFHASLLYLPVFMSGIMFHRLSDNQQCLTEENSESSVELSLSSQDRNVNQKNKLRNSTDRTQVRPPVSYASIAPFPFLPVPSYVSS